METRVFGIRHHGPGSARRLRAALEAWQPDLLLVEAPEDAGPALTQLVHAGVRPPVALVLYDAKSIERASFYPFAAFSPEYQAIDWAVRAGVDIRAIDLPARFYLAEQAEKPPELFPTPETAAEPSVIPGKSRLELVRQLRRDPLSLVAELAGYPDSESWWDATLERTTGEEENTFAAILSVVTELRDAFPDASDAENERREAFMRGEIRKAMKTSAERIAIVVGAWHGPAVADFGKYKATADRARLKGLPKIKIARAWVPWSFPRLARTGGYGAGVHSPQWYELLFRFPTNAVDRYMAAAAQLLREEGFDGSPAMATEAVGLANTLATLREYERPGIAELEEALLGTLAGGRPERLALIHEKLSIGTTVGVVPPGITTVPLLEDLQRELKSTRMAKLWETAGEHYLKATKTKPRGGIDLRQDNDLRKSHLLHRLDLLGLPWGRSQPLGPDTLSSFSEIWLLEWQPEYTLGVLERSSYGNTLPLAAAAYARERAGDLRQVRALTELILACLQADLPAVVPELLRLLRQRAAATTDIGSLLAALPALVNTSRYGDSRKTDTTALLLVIDDLLPRIAAGLPATATNIDEEQAGELLDQVAAAHYALAQLGNPQLEALWRDGLRRTLTAGANPLIEGYCIRLLYDGDALTAQEAAGYFSRALSAANGASGIANWLAGFLHGGGQLLLHYPPLWELVDDWVASLEWADFEGVVALLRRTFSEFSHHERRQLMQLAGKVSVSSEERATERPDLPPTEETLIDALLGWMG